MQNNCCLASYVEYTRCGIILMQPEFTSVTWYSLDVGNKVTRLKWINNL